jgi:hypothetical protein
LRVGKTLKDVHALPVGPAADARTEFGQVVLAVGVLQMREQFGPLAHGMVAPTHEVTRGAHFGRIDADLRGHAATQQGGNLVRVDLVVLGFAAVNRLHLQGMAQYEGKLFAGAQVGQPILGEDAFDADDDAGPVLNCM